MDGDLLLIFAFILTIIAIVSIGVTKIVNRTLSHKEWMAARNDEEAGTKGEDYKRLEERVRVLERIATDRGSDLAQEIEDLRDERVLENHA